LIERQYGTRTTYFTVYRVSEPLSKELMGISNSHPDYRRECPNVREDAPGAEENLFVYGDSFATAAYALEPDYARYFRKQRIVFAYANVVAGFDMSSTLSNNDGTGRDGLPAIGFSTSPLTLGVAAILGGTDTFFVSHFIIL
jgi:hypothetical protein